MNEACKDEMDTKWHSSILWCKLEDVPTDSVMLQTTTIAFMYDLCLKRLTRRAGACKTKGKYCIIRVSGTITITITAVISELCIESACINSSILVDTDKNIFLLLSLSFSFFLFPTCYRII